jgi:hypothetical protein
VISCNTCCDPCAKKSFFSRKNDCCAPAPCNTCNTCCDDCCDRPGLLQRLMARFRKSDCCDPCCAPSCATCGCGAGHPAPVAPKGEAIPAPKDAKPMPPGVEKKDSEVQAIPQPVTAPALEVAPRGAPIPF